MDEAEHTAQLLADGVQIDLGGIGKGYAVDRVAELLREWSIDIALVSGGYSSVLALDAPDGMKGWPLTLSNPGNRKQKLTHLYLRDRALSGSGMQKGEHIIDPRTGQPIEDSRAAWAFAGDAATSDALSTAFMIMSPDEVKQYCLGHSDTLAMVIAGEDKILRCGPWEEYT